MNTFDPDATEIRPSSKRQRMALLNGLHGPLDQEQKVHTTILNQQNGAAASAFACPSPPSSASAAPPSFLLAAPQ